MGKASTAEATKKLIHKSHKCSALGLNPANQFPKELSARVTKLVTQKSCDMLHSNVIEFLACLLSVQMLQIGLFSFLQHPKPWLIDLIQGPEQNISFFPDVLLWMTEFFIWWCTSHLHIIKLSPLIFSPWVVTAFKRKHPKQEEFPCFATCLSCHFRTNRIWIRTREFGRIKVHGGVYYFWF